MLYKDNLSRKKPEFLSLHRSSVRKSSFQCDFHLASIKICTMNKKMKNLKGKKLCARALRDLIDFILNLKDLKIYQFKF